MAKATAHPNHQLISSEDVEAPTSTTPGKKVGFAAGDIVPVRADPAVAPLQRRRPVGRA
jgi:hypothetical protein